MATFIGLLVSIAAWGDIIPPKNYATTPGGINISDGSLQYSVIDLSVGTMRLERFHRSGALTFHVDNPAFGTHFSSNFDIYVSISAKTASDNPRHPVVHMGNRASGVYGRYIGSNLVGASNKDAEKGILTYNGTTYTFLDLSDGSGTLYTFHPSLQAAGVQWASESRRIQQIDFPDGRRRTFSYDGSGNLKLVEDSTGYAMVFDYNANGDVTAACAFNRSQTYVSATSTCSGVSMKTTYAYSGATLLSSTDPLGNATNYTMSTKGMTCLKPPGYATCTMSMVYTGNRVSSQSLQDGGTWETSGMAPEVLNNPDANYDGDCTNETTMTDPNNVALWLTFTGTSPCSMTDALGYTTSFIYEGAYQYPNAAHTDGTFLKQASYPEGNTYQAEYLGPFWAITKETMVAKTGSGLASVVKTYGYQSSCSVAPATYQNCAKPIWIKDPKLNQTDFTYATHGGLLTEMKPAPTSGAPRPLKVITYLQKYAYVKNSSGALVQAATPIWLVNTETQCQTVAGSSTPTCDSGGPQVVTTYQYGADGTADNLLVRGIAVTADSQTRRTCFGYDVYSRRISETKPKAGLGVCP